MIRRRLLILLLSLLLASPAAAQAIRIEVTGLDPDSPEYENVRGSLSLARYRDKEMGESRMRRLHRRAESEIRTALRPFGYYEPEIESSLEADDGDWVARYRISPGPRVRVASVTVRVVGEAENDRGFQRALEDLPIKPDQPLNHQEYEATRTRLLEIAGRRGYLDAEWQERALQVDPMARLATVRLILDSGPRYRFGPVDIQQTILDDSFVQRYVPFETGDPFDADELIQLQFDLSDSDYFDFVQVRPDRDSVNDQLEVPVEVETTRRPKHRYRASLGYGTDTGPRYGLRYDRRRINKQGHRGALGYNISDIRRALELRYVIPLENPARERLTLDVNAIREDEGSFESRRREVAISRAVQWESWLRTIFLRYENETSIFGPNDESVTEVVVPGVRWSRTRSDNPTLPRRGLHLSLDLRGAREELLSDLNFAQATLEAKRVQPLTEDTRLLVRMELGATGTDKFDNLPLSQRFFTGGDRTVRGYAFESLSPLDDEGRRAGGRYLKVGSAEVDWRFTGNWFVAGFVDAGDATMSFTDDVEGSAGMGIRWGSPVGMVRLDVARSFTDPDRGYRLHLSVGPDL